MDLCAKSILDPQARCRIQDIMLPVEEPSKGGCQAVFDIELAYPADEAASLTSLTFRQEHTLSVFEGVPG